MSEDDIDGYGCPVCNSDVTIDDDGCIECENCGYTDCDDEDEE